jgi:hypothetical protein
MSGWGYVVAGWTITAIVLVAYAAVIIGRGRSISRKVDPERRRWM